MEGMPRFAPILPDLKKPVNGFDDEFVYSLKEVGDDPDNYENAITELRNIKQEVLRSHVDVEAVCVLKRYFAQLLMMKNRFPMEHGGAVQANFAWYERALEMPTAQSFSDINFEMACVMYQIGAIHASIAGQENRQSDDSIKNAFMHFQYAAWPLQNIRDNMEVSAFGTSDFDKELLTFHVNGQAQECLLEKSLLDKRSSTIVVKLAAYLRDLYLQCHSLLRNSNTAVEVLSSKKFKLWTRTVAVKSEIYGAISMLYMSYKEEEERHFGARLAWCQAADHYLTRALKVAGDDPEYIETVIFVRDVIKGRLENAKKENDFIYHERIPKFEELVGTVEGEGKVKPRSFDPLDPSIGGDDLFGALMPPTVLASASQYEEEKAKLKRDVLKRVNEISEELDKYMDSLNPEELGLTPNGIPFIPPEILLERNAAMNSQPDAVPSLLAKLQEGDKTARECDAELHSLQERLEAVDLPLLTEDSGYKAIVEEIKSVLEDHSQGRKVNAELHKALAHYTTILQTLSLPLAELVDKIAPKSETKRNSTAFSKEGKALIRVLGKVNEMRTQREMLLDTFIKELDQDNINKKLLAERDTDNTELFMKELKKHDKNIQYIDQNLKAQDIIMQHLTEANADFGEERKYIRLIKRRFSDEVKTLCDAYDIFIGIGEKSEEGKSFFDNLVKRVKFLKKAVDAITKTYFEEKEKIEKKRREQEQKEAAAKAAQDAQNALADFGGYPNQSLNTQQPVSSISSSVQAPGAAPARPRKGDYMQFYKAKMAAKTGQNYVPPPPMQSYVATPEHSPSPVPLPSPAPSSIAGDLHGEVHFPTAMYQQQHHPQSYNPPSPAYSNYAQQFQLMTEQSINPNFQQQQHYPATMTEQPYSPSMTVRPPLQEVRPQQPVPLAHQSTYQHGILLQPIPSQTPSPMPPLNRNYQSLPAENKQTYSMPPLPEPQMNYHIPQQDLGRHPQLQSAQQPMPAYQHGGFPTTLNQTPSPTLLPLARNQQQVHAEMNKPTYSVIPPPASYQEQQMNHQISSQGAGNQQFQPVQSAHLPNYQQHGSYSLISTPNPTSGPAVYQDSNRQQFQSNQPSYQQQHGSLSAVQPTNSAAISPVPAVQQGSAYQQFQPSHNQQQGMLYSVHQPNQTPSPAPSQQNSVQQQLQQVQQPAYQQQGSLTGITNQVPSPAPSTQDTGRQQIPSVHQSNYPPTYQAQHGTYQSQPVFSQPQYNPPTQQTQSNQTYIPPTSTPAQPPAANPYFHSHSSAFQQTHIPPQNQQNPAQNQQLPLQSQQYALPSQSQQPAHQMNTSTYLQQFAAGPPKEGKSLPSQPSMQALHKPQELPETPSQSTSGAMSQSSQPSNSPWNSRPTLMQAGRSPWHSNQTSSPWHQTATTMQSSCIPISSPASLASQETPVLGQGTPQTHYAPPTSSNMDLLSSLLGDLNMTPAIAPSQMAASQRTEYQAFQQAAPSQPRPTNQPPQEVPIVRPAAAVIPIPQKVVPKEVEVPILTMSLSSTVSIAPTNPVAQMTNPGKFDIGETDRTRLEKRQLHAAIRSNETLPMLDPQDPLNSISLDPYWKVNK